jgi:hypothetical protein
MASQRVTMIKVGGRAAQVITTLVRPWQHEFLRNNEPSDDVRRAVDRFAEMLREKAKDPPILFFAEWIDLWSMGDLLPGLGDPRAVILAGQRYQVCCHQPPVQFSASTIGGQLSQESLWLKQRLVEAEASWDNMVADAVILVLREPLGGLVTDQELTESLNAIPSWLADSAQST